jgi:hypothetical protein
MKLFEFERTWVTAAFDTIFPSTGTSLPHGIVQMNPGRFFSQAIEAARFEQAIGLRITLWIVALAPLFLLRRPKTIASIKSADRKQVLELLLTSPIYAVRQLVSAFKAMGSMLYAQSPAIRAAMTTPRLSSSPLISASRLTARAAATTATTTATTTTNKGASSDDHAAE